MAKQTKPVVTETSTPTVPQNEDEFIRSGWMHYSKKEYFRAEADFQKALEFGPDNPDTLYALAMTLQASGRPQDAIRTFEKVIQLLEQLKEENFVRAHMLGRLSRGHINRIKTGDWQLSQ